MDLHHHDFYEIYFLLSGDVTYAIEGALYRILPGDILLISPSELHQLSIRVDQDEYERYVLWLSPQTARQLSTEQTDLLQWLRPEQPGYHNQLRPPPEEQLRVYQLIRRFSEEFQAERYGSDVMSRSYLTQLLAGINRIASRLEDDAERSVRSSEIVSAAVRYIELHYGEPLSLDLLAERFHVSKYHLSHEFNRVLGTGVHRYILKKRLLIARQMITGGTRPSKVWEPCGFGDYTGFYRAFRAEYGASPKECRQNAPARPGPFP